MDPALTDRARVSGHERTFLTAGWQAASVEQGRPVPTEMDDLAWIPAAVPGTAAGALRDAGLPIAELDAQEWWFRTSFEAAPVGPGEEVVLGLDGLATLAEVFLNGERILASESMFARHAIDVGSLLVARNELAIRFRPLGPELDRQRSPRARWRTRLVANNNLRWFRSMLIGRIPGFAPGPPAVGPWRGAWLERRRGLVIESLQLRPRLDGDDGILALNVRLRGVAGPLHAPIELELEGPTGIHRAAMSVSADDQVLAASAELRIVGVARWWPHTHGDPALYRVRLIVGPGQDPITIEAGRVGFRSLAAGPAADHDISRDGLFLQVNGQAVFTRGALWTPLDSVGLAASPDELRAAIETAREAGMNMLRLPGFGAYEQPAFHDLCDELGVMVWQDLMFMSLDYPFADEPFGRTAKDEVAQLLEQIGGRASLAVLCGNSEVEQQVAMLGLDPALGRIPFFDAIVPGLVEAAGIEVIYVPSAPFGGDLPIRPNRGVTNYYGVGGYRQPLSDARTSGVLFAAECLAFANVPDDSILEELAVGPPHDVFIHDPRWKAGVARDAGAGWDFDDMRDHYFELLFGLDPGVVRRGDPARYLELSRAVTGEVMELVYGEWRRAGSPSGGGLILWLRDLVPGAGWGVVDHHGQPKTAYHHLRRILAPRAVWLTDERTGGVVAHVANDGPRPLAARLRIGLYSDQELPVGAGEVALDLAAHGATEHDVEAIVGGFVDVSWAYRFGPPAQDVIVASLEQPVEDGPPRLLSQAFLFPAGRPLAPEPVDRLGLSVITGRGPDGAPVLEIAARRLAYGVRIHLPGYVPGDDAFSIEPGGRRIIPLRPTGPDRGPGGLGQGGWLTALNLKGRVAVAIPEPSP